MRFTVYALICEQMGEACFVKIGFTTNLAKRVSAIANGCPLKIERTLTIDCKTEQDMERLEVALHTEFIERSVVGEWFRFDTTATAHAEMREAMELIGQREIGHAEVKDVQTEARRDQRNRFIGRFRKRANPGGIMVGDYPAENVQVVFKRRRWKGG